MDGQGEPQPIERNNWAAPLLAAALLLAISCLPARAAERATPSGYPVPRYITLKFDQVYARAGPGEDHRLLWVYRVKGLPVQVVAENSEWRRICDPAGGMAWVHKRLTDGRRNVLVTQGAPVAIRKKPKAEAEIVAYLNPRSMAALNRCEKGWCKVKLDGATGWTPARGLWGVSDALQCKAPARR